MANSTIVHNGHFFQQFIKVIFHTGALKVCAFNGTHGVKGEKQRVSWCLAVVLLYLKRWRQDDNRMGDEIE